MIDRTTVRLPRDLLARAKRKAVAERRTLTSLIEEGLRLVVNDKQGKARGKRIPPPVSTATGGTLPGIAISDSAALQEMEDIEYVERMKHFK